MAITGAVQARDGGAGAALAPVVAPPLEDTSEARPVDPEMDLRPEAVPETPAVRPIQTAHHSPAVLARFVGLLVLLAIAVVSLVFAVAQNSGRGIVLMIVTTAITGICFYFSWREFSDAKQIPNT